jgi:hypothetical protein
MASRVGTTARGRREQVDSPLSEQEKIQAIEHEFELRVEKAEDEYSAVVTPAYQKCRAEAEPLRVVFEGRVDKIMKPYVILSLEQDKIMCQKIDKAQKVRVDKLRKIGAM